MFTTLLWLLAFNWRIRQALQWWANKESMKRFLEAEKIRDYLLQESFAIRRSLDMLTVDDLDLSVNKIQDCVIKIDNFHQSLVEISDRLFPWHIQYSLPLAIECLLESRLVGNSDLSLHIDMPVIWRHQSTEHNLLILTILDELLSMALPEFLTPISIVITLKQGQKICYLMLQITYPDVYTMNMYTNLRELKYMCDIFYFMTSGKCVYRSHFLQASWCFYW